MKNILILLMLITTTVTYANTATVTANIEGVTVDVCHSNIEITLTDYENISFSIKSYESYLEKSKWDVKQHTNGWGTKAKYKGEKITFAEANKRYQKVYSKHFRRNRRRYKKHLSEWQIHVISSLTYNVGSIKKGSGLDKAIKKYNKNGDPYEVTHYMMKYTKAKVDGKFVDLPGLVSRRMYECRLFVATPAERELMGRLSKGRVANIIKNNT